MTKYKYAKIASIIALGMFLLNTDIAYIDSCCPRSGYGPRPAPAPVDPATPPAPPVPGVQAPKARPIAPPTTIPRPSLSIGIQPLIQSIQSLLGVVEPWEVWWTRNRDKYLSFREPIKWATIDDQGGTKSFSISPFYDELLKILEDGIADKDLYLAYRAAIAMGKVPDAQDSKASSPKAIEVLKKSHENEGRYFVRNNALLGWALTADPAAGKTLIEVLQSKDPALRRSYAALALGYIPASAESIKILKDILLAAKEDREVKSSACIALGNLKDISAISVLGKILTGEDSAKKEQGMIRAYAALGLGRIGNKDSLEELKKITDKEKEETVRLAVVTALGMTGMTEAKDQITAFLKDKNFSVRGMACIALAQIKDSNAYENISEALNKNKSNDADGLMLIALGLTGHEKAKTDLRAILADTKKSRALLRSAAAVGLGLLKDAEALPVIVNILKDDKQHSETTLTPYLLLSMAMINDGNQIAETMKKEQVDILEKMWKKIDKNLTITAYTNLAIALMKATSRTKVISELTQHVSSKNVTLRTYALHTLGLIGDKESAKVFIDSYKDNNPEVRKSTVDAIGFLMDRHQINPLDKITADNIDLTLEIMNHLLPIPVW